MADTARIIKEMQNLRYSERLPVNKVERIDDKDLIWKVVFEGPEESPYEDGIFTLNFIFPSNYPTKGPEARFITPMFHPNVDPRICYCS